MKIEITTIVMAALGIAEKILAGSPWAQRNPKTFKAVKILLELARVWPLITAVIPRSAIS